MPLWIYDSAAIRKAIQKLWIYDSAAVRKKISKMWIYDENANRKLIFSSGFPPAGASFTIINASALNDTNEGTGYGVGWGWYGTANQSDATSNPNPPNAVGGVGQALAFFTTFGNSGDVGLPGDLLIYTTSGGVPPNTNESFTQVVVSGIGTFLRSNAQYFAGPSGVEWRWTYAGPYLQQGQNYDVNFT